MVAVLSPPNCFICSIVGAETAARVQDAVCRFVGGVGGGVRLGGGVRSPPRQGNGIEDVGLDASCMCVVVVHDPEGVTW